MIELNNFLQDDNKTIHELEENVEIIKLEVCDLPSVATIMHQCMGVKNESHAWFQLMSAHLDVENSVKVIDKRDNKIYGILLYCKFPLHHGTPIMMTKYRPIGEYLSDTNQVNGFLFLLDIRLRGIGLDKEILNFNKEYLENKDIVWCAVENSLKSHKYWEKLGFTELFSNEDATFYITSMNKNKLLEIFILKSFIENHENNNVN